MKPPITEDNDQFFPKFTQEKKRGNRDGYFKFPMRKTPNN